MVPKNAVFWKPTLSWNGNVDRQLGYGSKKYSIFKTNTQLEWECRQLGDGSKNSHNIDQ
jgi:hypothetical protein